MQEDFLRGMKAMRNSERWRGSCTTCKRRIARWLLHNFYGAWLLRHIHTAEKWEKKKCRGSCVTHGQVQGGLFSHITQQGDACSTLGGSETPLSKLLNMAASLPSYCQRQCMPNKLKSRCWNPLWSLSSGFLPVNTSIMVNIPWSSEKHVPVKKPYGDAELQFDSFSKVGTSFPQKSNSLTRSKTKQKSKEKKN